MQNWPLVCEYTVIGYLSNKLLYFLHTYIRVTKRLSRIEDKCSSERAWHHRMHDSLTMWNLRISSMRAVLASFHGNVSCDATSKKTLSLQIGDALPNKSSSTQLEAP